MTVPDSDTMHPESFVNHPPAIRLAEGNDPLVAPIYQTVKFTVPSVDRLSVILSAGSDDYFYSRISNPTVRQLELTLAKLQGEEDGVAFASGIAAISGPLMSLLRSGDHVVMFRESYKPTRFLVAKLLAKFGVTHTIQSIHDLHGFENVLRLKKTRLVILESPTNPIVRIADVPSIVLLAQQHGAQTFLDNTFGGFSENQSLGIDYIAHSLTKFANGHGDVLGGVILSSQKNIRAMMPDLFNIGATLDPHTAALIQRGLKTYFLRFDRQVENAKKIAQYLENHPNVQRVIYPGLQSHPDYELGKKLLKSPGAIMAFEIKGGIRAMKTFIERLSLFRLASSVGSTDSLIAPVWMLFAGDLPDDEMRAAGLSESQVRISVGIENEQDLISDLEQALK